MVIKKLCLLLTLLLAFSLTGAYAQHSAGHDKSHDKHERIVAARIAHISSRLNLSPEQAQKFWPVYNEFSDKRENIRAQQRKIMHGLKDQAPSNDAAQKALNQHLQLEKEEAALEEEYYGKRLVTVVEPRQVLLLMHAEHEFKKMLLERLKDKDH